jgi:hypothetical protein
LGAKHLACCALVGIEKIHNSCYISLELKVL